MKRVKKIAKILWNIGWLGIFIIISLGLVIAFISGPNNFSGAIFLGNSLPLVYLCLLSAAIGGVLFLISYRSK